MKPGYRPALWMVLVGLVLWALLIGAVTWFLRS